MDEKITESNLLKQYLDTALLGGQYKIYCTALVIDSPMQNVIVAITCHCIVSKCCYAKMQFSFSGICYGRKTTTS